MIAEQIEKKRVYMKKYNTVYRETNKEKHKQYYAENKEKIREQQKTYWAKNKEKILSQQRQILVEKKKQSKENMTKDNVYTPKQIHGVVPKSKQKERYNKKRRALELELQSYNRAVHCIDYKAERKPTLSERVSASCIQQDFQEIRARNGW